MKDWYVNAIRTRSHERAKRSTGMKSLKWFATMLIVAVMSLLVAGCGSGGGDDPKPVPKVAKIVSLSPESVVVGGAAFTLTIEGKNFKPACVVKFDDTVRADAVVVDSSTITIPVTAADIATVGEKEISVDGATKTFVVKAKPWVTAVTAGGQEMVKAVDGLLYVAYANDNKTFLCRFDANGDKVAIADKTDVLVATSQGVNYPHGIFVPSGEYAYVVSVRAWDESAIAGFGEGFLQKINLATGEVTEEIIMLGGEFTGFTADNAGGAIYIAFAFHGQLGEHKTAVVGIRVTDAAVIFEQGWEESPRIHSVAVDATSLYFGGTVTNGSGCQQRMYVRKVEKHSGAFQWESQVNAVDANMESDSMYYQALVIDSTTDALYFSGVIGYTADVFRGAVFRIDASSADGTFAWGYVNEPGFLDLSFSLMVVDNGDLYGWDGENNTVRINPDNPPVFPWRMPDTHPGALHAADGILYMPYTAGKILLISKEGQVLN